MALIRIFAAGIELDFVNETLTLKQENNAFITDFKATYSSYPFLILENQKTKQALGAKNMVSVRKKKAVPVVVIENGQRYDGELVVTSYLNQYRKCNIKYGSSLLGIMATKCGDLLPVIDITGAASPVPFAEEYYQVLPGSAAWGAYPMGFNKKIYPEVKFGFPQMLWRNQFFDDAPTEGDQWQYYNGWMNRYDVPDQEFMRNHYSILGDNVVADNRNVAAPQLFLLGLLDYVFASQGWKIAGGFVADPFIKRLQVLSTKNNMCKVMVGPSPVTFHLSDFTKIVTSFGVDFYRYSFIPDSEGDYEISYLAVEPLRPGGVSEGEAVSGLSHGSSISSEATTSIYANYNDIDNLGFSGTFTINISAEMAAHEYYFYYTVKTNTGLPDLNITFNKMAVPFMMMHPTIQLGRYAPDWSVADALNQVKNTFCLDIKFDDSTKVATFNYAKDVLTQGEKFTVKNALAYAENTPPDYSGFVLKYSNDADNALYIDASGTAINNVTESEYVNVIMSRFKVVPYNGTANLANIEDKEGVGLMIYDPNTADGFSVPYISQNYRGCTTEITGARGIYMLFWKAMLRARLFGDRLTVDGAFTGQELARINKLQRIYMGAQAYIVLSTESKQTLQDNFTVKLELMAITL